MQLSRRSVFTLLLCASITRADVGDALLTAFARHLTDDPAHEDKHKGYFAHLEERRNIPKTFDEYRDKCEATMDLVHDLVQKNPERARFYAYSLRKVLDLGWANSWSQRNPGWSDLLIYGGVPVGICATLFALVVIATPRRPR